jgi:outer membrane protein TolC
LEYNLNLRKTRIDLAASGYSEKRIWSEVFPTISANAGATYSNSFFTGNNAAGNTNNFRYSTGFGVSLGLNAGIPYAMRNIRLAHEGNILRYEEASNLISIQITKSFYSLIAERNNLTLLEEIQNLAQRHYESNQILFTNGLIGELLLTQSRLSYENARYSFSAANTLYTNSMAEFLAMLGMKENEKVTLLGEVEIIRISADAEYLITEYLPRRPDILKNRQEIERLENAYRQTAMQSRAPQLNLSFDWTASNFDPFAESFSGSARLSIPVDPLIPGTSRSQTIGRARDSIEKAILDLQITEDAAKTQIRSLASQLRNSWDSILIARLSLEAAQRNYVLTNYGFNNGTVQYLTLADARNDMASARQRLLQSELSYFFMILDLSTAINVDWNYLFKTYGVTGG